MLTYTEALRILKQNVSLKNPEAELVSLENSEGRLLAQDILAPENLPFCSNSAMDGFLVKAPGHPGLLELQGLVAAGDQPISVKDGCAVEIMTGARLNFSGHEGVVRLEDTKRVANRIEILVYSHVGDHIRLTGSDIEAGQKILHKGQKIAPEQMMLLAALGILEIPVFRKLKAALISTGNEISNGQIRNSTGPYLISSLKNMGLDILNLGVCPDDPNLFDSLLSRALEWNADLIVSTGAVSVGAFDFVLSVLKKRQAQIYFHQVAIRPGKPILCAQVGSAVFFGLPGNPMASAVGLHFFIKPCLMETKPLFAKLVRDTPKPKGLRAFFQASLFSKPEGLYVDIFNQQASYCMSGLAHADAWAVLPEEDEKMLIDSIIEVYPL